MKRLLFILALVQIITSCTKKENVNTIANNNLSDYSIAYSPNSGELTVEAAKELQHYIEETSGAKLEITNDINVDQKFIIIIGKDLVSDTSFLKNISELKEDGFIIKSGKDRIYISGNNDKSNIYATYTFIEEYLGCRKLSADEEFVPMLKQIDIPLFEKNYNPEFSFRSALFPSSKNRKYRLWHKLEVNDNWGMYVHTFQTLLSPNQYYKSHPEYFSFTNGKRLEDAQLCLSNPEVINILKENLGKEILKSPEKKYWSVSQNDCYNYCECDGCKKMYEEYGSISGAYIYMANEIAKDFPDYQISTLAYQFTREAPTNIKPLDNVNIMFCSIECNRSKALEEDKRSKSFVKDMKDWSAITNNIYMWDYVVQFKNYLTPFPNFHVLQPNIKFFRDNNVDMMFQQGSNGNWSDLSEMKEYLIAKLLWSPDANVDSLINDFTNYYYGAAAPFINNYFELAHNEIKKHSESEFLNIYGFPMDYIDSHLKPELLKQYKSFMDSAEYIVRDDSVYLNRVLRTRLSVDFSYLDIALNSGNKEISFLTSTNEGVKINSDMTDYLNTFVENSKKVNASIINERSFSTDKYQEYVLRKLERSVIKNLANGKSISIKTKYSESYPVGGEKALTDGLLGDLDFHNNWLGFEGEDMEIEIDLQSKQDISKIDMSFLKAVNSWVFLPEKITVEVSIDGKNYKTAGELKGDNNDRTYLVRSIPHIIEFPTINTQYIRIKAKSIKKCPKWHRGYGKPSWIFIDELIIN